MILRNPLNFISQLLANTSKQIRSIYLNSNYYDKKISKINNNDLIYKPSPHLLSSLIKYQKKKINVDDISTENLWDNDNINFALNYHENSTNRLCNLYNSLVEIQRNKNLN